MRFASAAALVFSCLGLTACAGHRRGVDDDSPALTDGAPSDPIDAGDTGSNTSSDAAAVRATPRLGPMMGWNHWYAYRCGINQSVVLAQAKELVASGLAAAGYNLVALDDCWMNNTRAADGSLTWDPAKFPDGLPWLANQLHAMGLSFGVYEAVGTTTCQRLPGSLGHYQQDADTIASWGVDFVKFDYCGFPGGVPSQATLTADFQAFGAALNKANPAIVYSQELPICCTIGSPAFLQAVSDSSTFANMWRVAEDEKAADGATKTILGHLDADLHLYSFARPGHWNDLDMLLTGNTAFGWTLAQEQDQLAVWAIEASPLLISADLSRLTAAEIAALSNPHLIALDQSGQQASQQIADGTIWAVVKPDPRGGNAVLLINTGTASAVGHFTPAQLGLKTSTARVTDVWTGDVQTLPGLAYTLDVGATALLEVE